MTAASDRIDRIRRTLAELGVSAAEFDAARTTIRMPTVTEYLARGEAAAGPGAHRTYGNHWKRMAAAWSDRPLDDIRAIADGYLAADASPAHRVTKPRRLPSPRRALTASELAEIHAVVRTSGNDTALDALLLRLHTETACRRGGALGLRVADEGSGEQGWLP